MNVKEFSEIEEVVGAYYGDKVKRYGDTPKGVDWKDRQSQNLRFAVLSDLFHGKTDFSLLDVGCGTGEFLTYLRKHGFSDIRYTGFDVCEKMIELAEAKFAGVEDAVFAAATIDGTDPQHDYVISSGIFNVKCDLDEDRWFDYIREMVKAQFAAARIGTAFNCLTCFVDFTAPHLYYCNPGALMDYCKRELTRFVTIRHDYSLYEFTLYLYRDPVDGIRTSGFVSQAEDR